MISVEEAVSRILNQTESASSMTVSLKDAIGLVLAQSVNADRDYPPFNRATMDGFAIREEGFSPDRIYKFTQEVSAGMSIDLHPEEEAVRIMTGAPVPDGLNVVIKVEDSREQNTVGEIRFEAKSIRKYLNIALQGEDLKKGDLVFSGGETLSAAAISLLASLGMRNIKVSAPPKVSIISTGNEVVSIEQDPLPWQIRDSNSYSLLSFLSKFGIEPEFVTLVPDDESKIREALAKGLESDILLLSGGVSMGNLDLIPPVLKSLSVEQVFHKVLIKPGKPIWFGKRKRTAVFGLPGNPFSVQVCARIFVEPYIRKFLGMNSEQPLQLPFLGSRKKKNQLAEYFPVILQTNDRTGVSPKLFNGSGDIRAGLFSDGIALHASSSDSLEVGDFVEFRAWQ
ncbi:MoeA N-terminal region (domain I and II) [Leptospira inadai serovar Lyme str. 10]|uniref:Molybdopterin molybdenumtransferase n=2 Tax=Leptospira inadai serovar Lyme TaxID=293084 RepID=V6HAS4_9LEPT|nr:molybdopterin molybdotransferase MoeA [Leptospira inadai]EQA35558.1 MoeA N-terminal region (domain I and II) [Leptospira inadai serovar Lyme str. 10]PNV75987.1 molybdopterin molybdenumtransferase MoeA [Leptospira inadai serovar Lyme]